MSKHERFENMFPRDGGRRDDRLDDPIDDLVGGEDGQIDDYGSTEEDTASRFRLRREVKLGLALVGALALVLVGTFLWRTFRGTGDTVAATDEEGAPPAGSGAAQPPKTATASPAASTKPDAAASVGAKSSGANAARDSAATSSSSDPAEGGLRGFRESMASKTDRTAPDARPSSAAGSGRFASIRSTAEQDVTPPGDDPATRWSARSSAASVADPFRRVQPSGEGDTKGVRASPTGRLADSETPSRNTGIVGVPRVASGAAVPSSADIANPLRGSIAGENSPDESQGGAAGTSRSARSDAWGASERLSLPASSENTLSRSARIAAGVDPEAPPLAKSASKSTADAAGVSRAGTASFGTTASGNAAAASGAAALGAADSATRPAYPSSDTVSPPASSDRAFGANNGPPGRDDGFGALGARGGFTTRGASDRPGDTTANNAGNLGASRSFAAAPSSDQPVARPNSDAMRRSDASADADNFRAYPPRSAAASDPREAVQRSGATRRAVAGSRVYVVQEGESLMEIARYELGQAVRWTEIYELNRDRIGDRPHELPAGTQLILPAASGGAGSLTQRPGTSFNR